MFNIGDRVTTVTDDSYNGLSGTVDSRTTCSTFVDYTVLLDGKTNPLSFCADELVAAVPTDIVLTVSVGEEYYPAIARRGDRFEYTFEGDYTIAVEEVPATAYVQVKYNGKFSTAYTYVDPSGTLAVGDEVIVPVTYGEKPGKVSALGRGTWQGECKAVSDRLIRVPLA